MAAVEDKYKIRLSEQTLRQMKNVADLWAYIEEHQLQPSTE
jgi:acyl carrier protein